MFFGLGQDTWAIRYIMNLDHDEQPTFVGRDQGPLLDTLPGGSWIVLARQDRDLLAGTALEKLQPVLERRLNGNPCLVYRLP